MDSLIKRIFLMSLLLDLSACVTDQKFRVQFEPTLPVPYLIVPDNTPRNAPNDPYLRNNQPPQYNDHHHDEYQRDNDDDRGYRNQPQYEDDDYPYEN